MPKRRFIFSELGYRASVSVCCIDANCWVDVSKWRRNGGGEDLADPQAYFLVCRGIKANEMYERPNCSADPMSCPYLGGLRQNELKRGVKDGHKEWKPYLEKNPQGIKGKAGK